MAEKIIRVLTREEVTDLAEGVVSMVIDNSNPDPMITLTSMEEVAPKEVAMMVSRRTLGGSRRKKLRRHLIL
jgi:hypothetical protein